MKHPNDYYYLVRFQYLGFRYHGWQRQPAVKTVQGMMEKTLTYILGKKPFKILAAGRTDAMVSAHSSALQLILREKIDENSFLDLLNENLPADMKAIGISQITEAFNIIQDVLVKAYHYYFSYGNKIHPFSAPFMANIHETLDIKHMQESAPLFEGEHDFGCFCEQADVEKSYVRSIDLCRIAPNNVLQANFFPEESYMLQIRGKGFLRYQVRYIMGTLFALGAGRLTIADIKDALKNGGTVPISAKAPASGLILNDITFNYSS